MKSFSILILIGLAVGLASCATSPRAAKTGLLPQHPEIAVIPLRDCLLDDQHSCEGAGERATSVLLAVFNRNPRLGVARLPRPVSPRETLSDAEAVRYAKSKGYDYVLNGEVGRYAHPAHAALSLRILSTADGAVAASLHDEKSADGTSATPDDLMEAMAERLLHSL